MKWKPQISLFWFLLVPSILVGLGAWFLESGFFWYECSGYRWGPSSEGASAYRIAYSWEQHRFLPRQPRLRYVVFLGRQFESEDSLVVFQVADQEIGRDTQVGTFEVKDEVLLGYRLRLTLSELEQFLDGCREATDAHELVEAFNASATPVVRIPLDKEPGDR